MTTNQWTLEFGDLWSVEAKFVVVDQNWEKTMFLGVNSFYKCGCKIQVPLVATREKEMMTDEIYYCKEISESNLLINLKAIQKCVV